MRTQDMQGRPYAKLSELKEGDIVTVDGDFSCMKPWEQRVVKATLNGKLFIECNRAGHFLKHQTEGDYIIGVYKGKVKP